MSGFGNQQPSLSDYLGDILRGNSINQLRPQHPFLLDTLGLAAAFEKNTTHIMLLTLDEAQDVIDDLLGSNFVNVTTIYAGNIKDAVAGTKNISKLMSFADANTLVYRLNGFNIKAVKYSYQGEHYVKITGYASLRRILNGTRYKINHPEILELGIGKAGINAGIISGARFYVYFSMAYRAIQLIFQSDHDLAAFIGNLTMDVAKVVVAIYMTKIAVAFGTAIAGSMVVSVAVGIILIVAVGFLITYALTAVDEEYGVSDKLISAIREGMKERQKIEEWNLSHFDPLRAGLMNTHW